MWLLWFAVGTAIAVLMGLCARKIRGGFWLIPFAILEVVGIYAVCDFAEPLVTIPLTEGGWYEYLGVAGVIYFIFSFAWWLFVVIATQRFLLRRARRKLGWSPKSPKKK
ncbi:MAG: hypothetical protein J6T72_02585 [Alphaproteobacteria bacterium]|nr:hypothetical protein [Alphaproteobacteria bacterium]